jgi:hypothetical protein
MKLRDDVNEHGTPITVFQCEVCGAEFSVCPAVLDEHLDNWRGCLAPSCASYDESRDADKMFEEGNVKFVRVISGNA